MSSSESLFIFIDQFTSGAVLVPVIPVLRVSPILFTGKRFLKEYDDISDASADSGSWICVNELYL